MNTVHFYLCRTRRTRCNENGNGTGSAWTLHGHQYSARAFVVINNVLLCSSSRGQGKLILWKGEMSSIKAEVSESIDRHIRRQLTLTVAYGAISNWNMTTTRDCPIIVSVSDPLISRMAPLVRIFPEISTRSKEISRITSTHGSGSSLKARLLSSATVKSIRNNKCSIKCFCAQELLLLETATRRATH